MILSNAFLFQPPYLKVDFSRWKDEDDSDVDDAMNEPNLEDVSIIFCSFFIIFCSFVKKPD